MRPHSLVWALCIASVYMIKLGRRKSLFIIGHMANDISTAKRLLDEGANALEIDIRFNSSGHPTEIYHGFPCDCWRYCTEKSYIETYLREIRKLASEDGGPYREALGFLMLDLKTEGVLPWGHFAAGHELGVKIARSLWNNGFIQDPVPVILSIPHTRYGRVLEGARVAFHEINHRLLMYTGYAIDSFSEGAKKIAETFRYAGIYIHRWIGTGITNCLPYAAYSEENNLLYCRLIHESYCDLVDKAFHWTIDTQDSIRKAIQKEYDGVITNDPEDAVIVARKLGVRKSRRWDVFQPDGFYRY